VFSLQLQLRRADDKTLLNSCYISEGTAQV